MLPYVQQWLCAELVATNNAPLPRLLPINRLLYQHHPKLRRLDCSKRKKKKRLREPNESWYSPLRAGFEAWAGSTELGNSELKLGKLTYSLALQY